MNAPENLARLHDNEETLRAESLRRIGELPDLTAHLHIIKRAMDLIFALLPSTAVTDEDELHVGNLGIRCLNALASSLELMLGGHYQVSALRIRDLLETTFQAAEAFREVNKVAGLDAYAAWIGFMHEEASWLKHFSDQEPDEAKLAELRELLALARAEGAGKGDRAD